MLCACGEEGQAIMGLLQEVRTSRAFVEERGVSLSPLASLRCVVVRFTALSAGVVKTSGDTAVPCEALE